VGPSLSLGSFYSNDVDAFVERGKGREKNVASN
jgi:hypothetical protein